MKEERSIYTTGDLARRSNVSMAQLKYALESARIEPAGRLGICRYFTTDQLPQVQAAIDRIARHRREPVPA